MHDSLLTLFQLQKIDHRLCELEQCKLEIPQRIDVLGQEYNEADRTLIEKEQQLKTLQQERRQHERDLEADNEQVRKYQGQLLSVKTNKEYDALQTEIQAQKAEIIKHEEHIIQLMTEIEDLSLDIEQVRVDVARQKQQIMEAQHELREQLIAVDRDVRGVLDERQRTLVRIEQRVIRTYERIRKGKNGVAVVSIKKGACGGCFNMIPLQKIAEIRRMDRLMTCENCGRILVPESQE